MKRKTIDFMYRIYQENYVQKQTNSFVEKDFWIRIVFMTLWPSWIIFQGGMIDEQLSYWWGFHHKTLLFTLSSGEIKQMVNSLNVLTTTFFTHPSLVNIFKNLQMCPEEWESVWVSDLMFPFYCQYSLQARVTQRSDSVKGSNSHLKEYAKLLCTQHLFPPSHYNGYL